MKSIVQIPRTLGLGNPCKVLISARTETRFIAQSRLYHEDGRKRTSAFWMPTGGIEKFKSEEANEKEDSHSLLIRAGYIRQVHAGIYQFLPLGLRVQEKIEKLVDKHMVKLGASKLSLSTLSSEELWGKSGRLDGSSSELFRLMDRKRSKYLLSPTHEEEITSLVGGIVQSYKELPLRLYQITRKYRDEPRPRQGLLRTREFLMKDLYTFDATPEEALETYKIVRQAYSAFFNEFKIPFLTAEATSGDMGGDLSHEYHFRTLKGEDIVISCNSCDYIANEELAQSRPIIRRRSYESRDVSLSVMHQETDVGDAITPPKDLFSYDSGKWHQWVGITRDRNNLVQAFVPKEIEVSTTNATQKRKTQVNIHALKGLFPNLDLSVQDAIAIFKEHLRSQKSLGTNLSQATHVLRVFDVRYTNVCPGPDSVIIGNRQVPIIRAQHAPEALNLVKMQTGDHCPKCEGGMLIVEPAVELGHTFHLGTRYSVPLKATVASKNTHQEIAMQMGCHGIGISRLIAAVADSLADSRGLNWPRVIAPFEVVIIGTIRRLDEASEVYDALTIVDNRALGPIDAILDDREKTVSWKLKDADLIGYPVIIVVGSEWEQRRKCEVQCRRLRIKEMVPMVELRIYVEALLRQL